MGGRWSASLGQSCLVGVRGEGSESREIPLQLFLIAGLNCQSNVLGFFFLFKQSDFWIRVLLSMDEPYKRDLEHRELNAPR
jgi:hypothetical protein